MEFTLLLGKKGEGEWGGKPMDNASRRIRLKKDTPQERGFSMELFSFVFVVGLETKALSDGDGFKGLSSRVFKKSLIIKKGN